MGCEDPTQPLNLLRSHILPLLLLFLLCISSFLPSISSFLPQSSSISSIPFVLLLLGFLLSFFIDTPSLSVTFSLILFLLTVSFHIFKPSKVSAFVFIIIQLFLLFLSITSLILNYLHYSIHLPSIFSSVEWGLYVSTHSLSL